MMLDTISIKDSNTRANKIQQQAANTSEFWEGIGLGWYCISTDIWYTVYRYLIVQFHAEHVVVFCRNEEPGPKAELLATSYVIT